MVKGGRAVTSGDGASVSQTERRVRSERLVLSGEEGVGPGSWRVSRGIETEMGTGSTTPINVTSETVVGPGDQQYSMILSLCLVGPLPHQTLEGLF